MTKQRGSKEAGKTCKAANSDPHAPINPADARMPAERAWSHLLVARLARISPPRLDRPFTGHRHDARTDRAEAARAMLSIPILIASLAAPPVAAADAIPAGANEAARAFAFGIVSNLPRGEAETGIADTVLASLALGDVLFAVDAGNIKGADETCSDRLYERRYDWLQRAPLPIVFVPGENDWIACQYLGTDAGDPVQRLDALRARFYPDSRSLGTSKIQLSRQSSYPGFRAYRENTRWRADGVTFVTLNAVGMNNHYVRDGGRNGEFEDRTVANRVWLERTVALARRDRSRALIIVVGVNPWSNAPSGEWQRWWRALTGSSVDPYRDLRRDLLKAVDAFDGPVYLIHRLTAQSAMPDVPTSSRPPGPGRRPAGPQSGIAAASTPATPPTVEAGTADADAGIALATLTRDGPKHAKSGQGTWHGRFGWLRITVSNGHAPSVGAHWYGLDASALASRGETATSPLPVGADRLHAAPAATDVLAPDLPPLPPSRGTSR